MDETKDEALSLSSAWRDYEQLRKLWDDHPNLVSWLVLAVGMVIIVVIAARNVGFTAGPMGCADRGDDRPGRAVCLDHQLGRRRRGAERKR